MSCPLKASVTVHTECSMYHFCYCGGEVIFTCIDRDGIEKKKYEIM